MEHPFVGSLAIAAGLRGTFHFAGAPCLPNQPSGDQATPVVPVRAAELHELSTSADSLTTSATNLTLAAFTMTSNFNLSRRRDHPEKKSVDPMKTV
jgi:hypothetical protein